MVMIVDGALESPELRLEKSETGNSIQEEEKAILTSMSRLKCLDMEMKYSL